MTRARDKKKVAPVTPEVTGKYRVYHYYPKDIKKTDYIDIKGKGEALEHYHKSRTAQAIWEIRGGKRVAEINPRTGEYLFPKFAPKPARTSLRTKGTPRITPKRPRLRR